MRFSTIAACLSVCAAPIAAVSVTVGKTPNVAVNDDLKIPGESPLELCPGEHKHDLVTIDKVDLTPNPPRPGQKLVIEASGSVKETIEEGAYIMLTVKYGLIRIISTKADLCEQIGNVDLKCPLEKGDMNVTKEVDIPAEVPPGKYTVLADVYTVDDVQITCLTATVQFSRGGGSSFYNIEL